MSRRPRFLVIFLLCCLGLGFLAGCLYIPQRQRQVALRGERLTADKLSMIVPGQTTGAEIIDQVGQPYLMLDDFGVMAYYWKMLTAYVPYAFGMGYGGGAGIIELSETSILLISYDAHGIVCKYETIHPRSVQTVNEQAIAWVGQSAYLTTFTPILPPPGKAVVYIFQAGEYEPGEFKTTSRELGRKVQDYDISGVFLDGRLWAEIIKGQYCVMILPPGSRVIGVELGIRRTDRFLHLQRQRPEPAYTTSLDVLPGQSYVLEIFVREVGTKDSPHLFRQTLAEAQPKLARCKRVR